MKKTGLYLLFFVQSFMLLSQKHEVLEPALLEVRYKLVMQQDTIHKNNGMVDSMILRIGDRVSQFFSYRTFYYDSIWTDPEGRKIAEELTLEAFRTGNHSKRPEVGSTYEYMYKNYPEKKLTVMSKRLVAGFTYKEEYLPQNWIVSDSIKQILGHDCRAASCDFRGRTFFAWFAPDIPVKDGPWKLNGLPGLILEAYDKSGHYHFLATNIQTKELSPLTFFRFEEYPYIETDRKLFLKSIKMYLSGERIEDIDLIKDVIWKGKKQLYFRKTKKTLLYDFLERDYE